MVYEEPKRWAYIISRTMGISYVEAFFNSGDAFSPIYGAEAMVLSNHLALASKVSCDIHNVETLEEKT